MTTRKQSLKFPTVAQIRTGAKKSPTRPGADLKDRFRIEFFPGADPAISARFKEVYGDLTPTRIRAMVPFPSVWEAWTSYDEAHNAGLMLAQADPETRRYLSLRDPENGNAYVVRDGQPYREYEPPASITYKDAKGKSQRIKLRPSNRLDLFLPELGRLVNFEFKNTAYYNRINIRNNLAAIQALANTLNGGNAAGVPFEIYRMEGDISYLDENGQGHRVKKWLVHLEADPEWVKAAIARLSKFALTGEGLTTPLLPIEVPYIPGTDPGEDEDTDEPFEAQTRDVPPRRQPAAAANSPLARFQEIGEKLWPGVKWPEVRKAILDNQNPASLAPADLKKALAFVEKRQQEIAEFKTLEEHLKKAWPESALPADLAHTLLAAQGDVDHLLLIQAVAQADGQPYPDPDTHAQVIVGHYLQLIPELQGA